MRLSEVSARATESVFFGTFTKLLVFVFSCSLMLTIDKIQRHLKHHEFVFQVCAVNIVFLLCADSRINIGIHACPVVIPDRQQEASQDDVNSHDSDGATAVVDALDEARDVTEIATDDNSDEGRDVKMIEASTPAGKFVGVINAQQLLKCVVLPISLSCLNLDKFQNNGLFRILCALLPEATSRIRLGTVFYVLAL